jgi:hypothetical protein
MVSTGQFSCCVRMQQKKVLQRYIYKLHPRLSKFEQFEVWIISDCPAFDTDLVQYFHDDLLPTYQQHLHDNNIWVQHIERYMLESIPCMLLVNSFSRDRDDLIVAELQE